MHFLKEAKLDTLIPTLKQPVLGICLGLQLMCKHTEENDTHCLNIFDIEVKRFPAQNSKGDKYKVPQMGWNSLRALKSPLMKGISERDYVYFVHSYYAALSEETIAISDYAVPFSAALHRNNFYATQFHPEKSAEVGEQILKNFITL